MSKKLYTHWRRPPSKPEEMDPLTQTESKGYIPPKQQIENLINAGRRLVDWRKEMYDFPDGEDVDDAAEDPTRGPGYDLADYSRDAQAVAQRLRAQAAANKAKVGKDTAGAVKIDPEPKGEGNEPKKNDA